MRSADPHGQVGWDNSQLFFCLFLLLSLLLFIWELKGILRKYRILLNQGGAKETGCCLCYSGWSAVAVHRCHPTSDQHGSFDLLHFQPGPAHPSLGNLTGPHSWEVTILMPTLVRTHDRYSPLLPRTPGLKGSSASASQVAGTADLCTRAWPFPTLFVHSANHYLFSEMGGKVWLSTTTSLKRKDKDPLKETYQNDNSFSHSSPELEPTQMSINNRVIK